MWTGPAGAAAAGLAASAALGTAAAATSARARPVTKAPYFLSMVLLSRPSRHLRLPSAGQAATDGPDRSIPWVDRTERDGTIVGDDLDLDPRAKLL